MPKRSKPKTEKEDLNSWVASLAKGCTETTQVSSKQQRMEKRAAKKRRREERKAVQRDPRTEPKASANSKMESTEQRQKLLLSLMAAEMKECITRYLEVYESQKGHLYQPNPNVKAKNLKKSWVEETIQPRKKDYGGIGLARPSMFLSLDDPSFFPKLEMEFAEHIPGFFGKQRTKAMKKQQAGKMLWRQLADKKNGHQKVNGKKLSEMTPDERVEAMLKAGMI